MVDETGRAHEETEKAAFAADFLDAVEKTADNVVAAGSLTAAEDNAYSQGRVACRSNGVGVFLEAQFGQTVCVRKQLFDFFAVGG